MLACQFRLPGLLCLQCVPNFHFLCVPCLHLQCCQLAPVLILYSVEFQLVAHTDAVALGVVEIVRVLVGGVREKVQPQGAGAVQFYFNVYVAHHVGVGACRLILPVTYVSVHHHAVVEQLCRDGHVENVVSFRVGLIVQSKVYRDVEPLEDVVELVGHHLRDVGVEQGRTIHDAGLLVRKEAVRDNQRKKLLLNLVFSAERTLNLGLYGRVYVRDVNREPETRVLQLVRDADSALHRPSRAHRRCVRNQR